MDALLKTLATIDIVVANIALGLVITSVIWVYRGGEISIKYDRDEDDTQA